MKRSLLISILLLSIGISPALAMGEEPGEVLVRQPAITNIPLGLSVVIENPTKIKRATIANPEVADQIVLSPTQIFVAGKSIGETTLTLWDQDGSVANVINLVVHIPVASLNQNISTIFPDETEVAVIGANDHIILTGQVLNKDIKDKIGRLAGAYAPQKVLNWLKYLKE